MANPYPRELRERAVRAYDFRTERYQAVAARFEISPATLMRWVQRQRETGAVDPLAEAAGGSRPSSGPCSSAWSMSGRTRRARN